MRCPQGAGHSDVDDGSIESGTIRRPHQPQQPAHQSQRSLQPAPPQRVHDGLFSFFDAPSGPSQQYQETP